MSTTPDSSEGVNSSRPWHESLATVPPARLAEAVVAALKERTPISNPTVEIGMFKERPTQQKPRGRFILLSDARTLAIAIYPDASSAQRTAYLYRPEPGTHGGTFSVRRVQITGGFQEEVNGWPVSITMGKSVHTGKGTVTTSILAHCGTRIGNIAIVSHVSLVVTEQGLSQARSSSDYGEQMGHQMNAADEPVATNARNLVVTEVQRGVEVVERAWAILPSLPESGVQLPPLLELIRSWPDPADYGLGELEFNEPEALEGDDDSAEGEEDEEDDESLFAEEDGITCPFCNALATEGCTHFVDLWDDELQYAGSGIGDTFLVVARELEDSDRDRVEYRLDNADLHRETKQLIKSFLLNQYDDNETKFLEWLQGDCGAFCDSQWWEGSAVSGESTACFHRNPRYLSALLQAVEDEALDWLEGLPFELDEEDEDEDEDE